MINSWEPGRADINAQLTAGYLQKVKPDRRLAELYIEHAKLHLAASRQTLEIDATGSFQLAYDASRKALAFDRVVDADGRVCGDESDAAGGVAVLRSCSFRERGGSDQSGVGFDHDVGFEPVLPLLPRLARNPPPAVGTISGFHILTSDQSQQRHFAGFAAENCFRNRNRLPRT